MKKVFDLTSKSSNLQSEAVVDLRKIEKSILKIPSSGNKLPPSKEKEGKNQQVIWWLMEEPPITFHPLITPLFCLFILSMGVYSFFQKNWLFFILIIVSLFAYLIFIFQTPKKRLFRLTKEGISIDNNFYPYRYLKGFSIVNKRNIYFLALEINQFAQKHLLIPIRLEKKEKIVNFLRKYLPEKEYQESFLEFLTDFLGF